MITTQHRNIPQTMGTQHPDNANAPYWESQGDGFVSTQEEVKECASSFKDLGCEEYMWDWEGKYVDEGVIEKLLTEHYDFFSQKQIGVDRFLTFRIPNIWEEKGRSLARAFMNMLTAEEFARDLDLHGPPLFEVILPMADSADKMIHLQKTFTQLARFKHELFKDQRKAFDYMEMIPLIEGVHSMESVQTLLNSYVRKHEQYYKRKPPYMRVFLARSDPALISGLVPAVLGNKIAISELYSWSAATGIDVYPWVGVGSLPFRGGLRPDNIPYFLKTYPGIRSVSIQSAFRYDFSLPTVKKAIKTLNTQLSKSKPMMISVDELRELKKIIALFERTYQETIFALAPLVHNIAAHVPARRERRLHIGLLGYGRSIDGKNDSVKLPRAITFTAAMYSLGIPPEFIGTGRALAQLKPKQFALVQKYYPTLMDDLVRAGQYLNTENLAFLKKDWPAAFTHITEDVRAVESVVGRQLGPQTPDHFIHRNWTSTLYFAQKSGAKKQSAGQLSTAILESAKIRKSLG